MSHFSFTRGAYDKCAIEKKDQESEHPFQLLTDKSVRESKSVCFQSTSPFMQNPYNSIPSSVVDIESELRGYSFELSKCPTHKYNPSNSKKIDNIINECTDNGLIPEYTRTNKSCNIFSGITINRFHPLYEDLQSRNKIHDNSYIGTNTRLQMQEAFEKTQKL